MEEVKELLTAWGLVQLTETFTDNAISLEALASLTPDVIRELIPKVGLRVLFLRCWRTWFSEYVGQHPPESESSLLNIDLSATALEVFGEEVKSDVVEGGNIFTLIPVHSLPESSQARSESVQDGDLWTLLKENLETAGLLAYVGDSLSGDRVRNILAAAIANKILQEHKNTSVRGEIYYKWCTEIKKLFPGERTTTYYIPACKTAQGITHQARGKLVK